MPLPSFLKRGLGTFFHMEMSCHPHANKVNFLRKGCASGLTLIERLEAIRKWPIPGKCLCLLINWTSQVNIITLLEWISVTAAVAQQPYQLASVSLILINFIAEHVTRVQRIISIFLSPTCLLFALLRVVSVLGFLAIIQLFYSEEVSMHFLFFCEF